MIAIARSFEQLKNFDFNNYSILYIGGGNTYKLLKGIKENGIFEKIREFIDNDGIIVGGSAGSVIFGKDINIIASMDDNEVELEDTKGFDCFGGASIFPHYINYKSKYTKDENEKRIKVYTESIVKFSLNNGKVFAIPEEDVIYLNDDGYEILGTEPYYI